MPFWLKLAEHLGRGEPAFVAVVADHTRHSPGTRGAKLFLTPSERQVGTIGGGIMEANVLARAREALAGRAASSVRVLHHRTDPRDAGEPSGLMCAGKQTLMTFVAEPVHASAYREFAALAAQDELVELSIDRGHPEILPCAIADAIPAGMRGHAYVEHAVNHHRVAIAGGGHCGLALSRTMRELGYHVQVFEERPDVYTLVENDYAHERVVVSDYAEAAAHVRFPSLTHFIVMTANCDSDIRALLGTRGLSFAYKGVMGSQAKIARIRDFFAERGADDVVQEIYAPIGLQMTSNTPAEIAVSVAAQILREREKLFPWTRPSPMAGELE